MKTTTVLLADDHTVFRQGLRLLLEAVGDIVVVGEADNGHAAVAEVRRLMPDIVLLDIAMPLLNGVEAARRISEEAPSVKVLILSTYHDDQHVYQAIEAGAAGYLMKEVAARDLVRAIREVSRENAFFSPPIARRLLRHWQRRHFTSEQSAAPVLTSRQTEVVQLIAEGYSTKQIAGLLAVSSKTVEKHRQALMDRLDIHEIATLTRYAVSAGVVDANTAPIGQMRKPAPHRPTRGAPKKTRLETDEGVSTEPDRSTMIPPSADLAPTGTKAFEA